MYSKKTSIIYLVIIIFLLWLGLSKNLLRYKPLSEGEQGLIISIEENYIAISDTVDEIAIYVKYDENTIVFNEKWREKDINELKVRDTIEVHTSGELRPTLPMTHYGEVILIL